ncbi:hypothetical protein BFJ63_vAg18026 [Fusarium oxysporum f. sp. narcissi]|uniref:Rhodopsin domain-containing protein n=1 Tax=Fusarium oxysporum f. sp. narcissi TaxID=451672 RepID=A0A4Q2V5E7_FUSOX|nr:hypothetical protein BFJ63_vAg18026 [Fusarium oxysporum f. sp. narcissi]
MDPDTDGSNRFSPVTFNDHAGQLWIVTILSLIYSGLVAFARAYIKYKMFGFDDILFALATILHLAQSIAIFVGLGSGLAKHNSTTTPEQWATSSKSTVAAAILTLLSLSLAKCSVLALVLRIIGSKPGKSKPFCIGLMVFTVAWGIGSSVAWLANCRADALLTVNNVKQCPSQTTRWAVITAIDIVTEIITWGLVVQLSWSVHTSFARKCQIVMAFSFRLPLIAVAAVHLAYSGTYPTASEPQFAVTNTLLCQQVMVAWSLISASVPNLKNFLKSFSIGMGFPVAFDLTMSGNTDAYALQSIGKSRSANHSAAATGVRSTTHSAVRGRPHNWRPDQVSNQTTAAHDRDNLSEEGRSSRAGSQEMIINKEVAWNVTYEDHEYTRP